MQIVYIVALTNIILWWYLYLLTLYEQQMKNKELQNILKKLPPNMNIQFYYLDNYDLENCKLETILEVDKRIEITIETTREQ